jgi:3-oxoacyl-[acyl-carrier protein] reductase
MPETPDRPVALVTGASRGIGRAIALDLARDHHVIAAARNVAELESLARELTDAGGSAEPLRLDLRDRASVPRALDARRVDVLVNNAGLGALKPFLELTREEWDTMLDVNVNALYDVTRALLPGMVERGRGHVVIIGSIAGRNAFVGGSCYAGTKHFVMAFAESLMLEVRDAGVKVSVVMPGSVATAFSATGASASWNLRPDEVAASVGHMVRTPGEVLVHRLEIRALSPKRPRGG